MHIKGPSCTCKSLERATLLAHKRPLMYLQVFGEGNTPCTYKAPHVPASLWKGQHSLHIKGPSCTCKSLERATLLAHKRPLMYLQVFGEGNTPCTYKAPHVPASLWKGQHSLHIKGLSCTCKSLERAMLLVHKRPLLYLQVFGKGNTPCT